MNEIEIGRRWLGDSRPCYIIAEVGSNHDRDLDKARRLIDIAVEAGADAAKFQTYSGSKLYSRHTPRMEYLGDLGAKPASELLDEISLPREWHPILAEHCRLQGIEFLSTPFDADAVDLLVEVGVSALKVASFEIEDVPLIEHIGSKGLPVIVSTGMSTVGEIGRALEVLQRSGTGDLALLQCASVYPARAGTMNLRAIPAMKGAFGIPVGLSDHTLGTHIAVAGRAIGANIIEKHITLDRTGSGPDHSFALEPDELHRLVAHVRDVEAALGDGVKRGPSSEEAAEMYVKARRSVVAARAIPAGTVLERSMLTSKRPGHGIKPVFMEAVVGRTARVDIGEDEVITWEII